MKSLKAAVFLASVISFGSSIAGNSADLYPPESNGVVLFFKPSSDVSSLGSKNFLGNLSGNYTQRDVDLFTANLILNENERDQAGALSRNTYDYQTRLIQAVRKHESFEDSLRRFTWTLIYSAQAWDYQPGPHQVAPPAWPKDEEIVGLAQKTLNETLKGKFRGNISAMSEALRKRYPFLTNAPHFDPIQAWSQELSSQAHAQTWFSYANAIRDSKALKYFPSSITTQMIAEAYDRVTLDPSVAQTVGRTDIALATFLEKMNQSPAVAKIIRAPELKIQWIKARAGNMDQYWKAGLASPVAEQLIQSVFSDANIQGLSDTFETLVKTTRGYSPEKIAKALEKARKNAQGQPEDSPLIRGVWLGELASRIQSNPAMESISTYPLKQILLTPIFKEIREILSQLPDQWASDPKLLQASLADLSVGLLKRAFEKHSTSLQALPFYGDYYFSYVIPFCRQAALALESARAHKALQELALIFNDPRSSLSRYDRVEIMRKRFPVELSSIETRSFPVTDLKHLDLVRDLFPKAELPLSSAVNKNMISSGLDQGIPTHELLWVSEVRPASFIPLQDLPYEIQVYVARNRMLNEERCNQDQLAIQDRAIGIHLRSMPGESLNYVGERAAREFLLSRCKNLN